MNHTVLFIPMDTKSRSIAKALSYRLLGTVGTIAVAWAASRELTLAMQIGGIDVIVKVVLYYVHERMWAGR